MSVLHNHTAQATEFPSFSDTTLSRNKGNNQFYRTAKPENVWGENDFM